jgi:predicted nucleotidyltransferase
MLKTQDLQILQVLKQRIQSVTPVKQMVVFGSRARGDSMEDSDLDVFIELPSLTPGLRQQIREIAWEISFDYGIIISTFLTSSASLVDGPLAANPILRAIELEGIAV